MAMAKRTEVLLLAVLILTAVFSRTDVAESIGVDCYDACSTGCVQPNARLMARCDRKCQIKCEPDLSVAEGNVG
ncbi:hypothetical protein BT93_L1366 [Corymbia citriodora subsp. variegata]|uniref:Uncharacterized protein n=1 Tax=Corymbia citriodora subsp. variegata TaxID=360336 RepID=A0A8T0CP45_CORYI|nr:hypothetical protein BT93_L1366 [Corymbia citriodora subsp. variegata]